MKSKVSYYLILLVYALLWICQLIAGHLTHSLIILTDSYINLYKILDISLGLLHLNTQNEFKNGGKKRGEEGKETNANEVRLFGNICTYQFKRLPLLGSFVNGLFLAALLMSAAIEGIQTCFHASHLAAEGETSILLAHPITYPAILVGFALVGSLMQWCSTKAHAIRDEELQSASLLDIRHLEESQKGRRPPMEQLTAIELEENSKRIEFEPYSPKFRLTNKQPKRGSALSFNRTLSLCLPATLDQQARQVSGKRRRFVLNSARHRSSESVPTEINEQTRISLISLKSAASLAAQNSTQQSPIGLAISDSLASSGERPPNIRAAGVAESQACGMAPNKADKYWLWVRYSASPIALISCAQIVYLINNELITEVADATLSILVVVLLFLASYPPMKKAGKVLLQTAPPQVNLETLKAELSSVSPFIQEIQELHVWSLTPRSNRIGTCKLVFKLEHIKTERNLSLVMGRVRQKFLEQDIHCTTIEPVLVPHCPKVSSAASQSAGELGQTSSGCCTGETSK